MACPDAMTHQMRRADGFTLPELLIGITMATIIMLAAFALLDTAIRRTGETQARVEATQRGRQAPDVITRELRSQVCLPSEVLAGTPTAPQPAIAAASPFSTTFYVDLTDGTASFVSRVEKRVLTYDPAGRRLVEDRYRSTGVVPLMFQEPPSRKVLVTNVVPDTDDESRLPDGSPAIFRYYAFGPAATPTVEVINPTASERARIARIDLAFVTRAGSEQVTGTPAASLTLRDRISIRAADPNDPAPYPTCA